MAHDLALRSVAREIYEACYPGDEWTLVTFEDAERWTTIQYRQAVDAALRARSVLLAPGEQLVLFAT